MKMLALLPLLVLASSCVSGPMAWNDDEQRLIPASGLDALRGVGSGKRDAELMRFADHIIAKAGKREVDDSGTTYPGTVKVMRWTHRGQEKYTALRLATWPGAPSLWQGPNPPSGFYAAKIETEYLY